MEQIYYNEVERNSFIDEYLNNDVFWSNEYLTELYKIAILRKRKRMKFNNNKIQNFTTCTR